MLKLGWWGSSSLLVVFWTVCFGDSAFLFVRVENLFAGSVIVVGLGGKVLVLLQRLHFVSGGSSLAASLGIFTGIEFSM